MEGNMKDSKEYKDARQYSFIDATNSAHIGAGIRQFHNTGFRSGYNFAMSQPKHIFDGVANAGEVRRFEDYLVDVVVRDGTCNKCVCNNFAGLLHCNYLIGCKTNNVKYIKR